jgi:hypothetical protein
MGFSSRPASVRVYRIPSSEVILAALDRWQGERMPLDGRWIEEDVGDLQGEDRAVARLAIVLAKASYRTTDEMIAQVMGPDRDEERFVRILAWTSFSAARRFAGIVAERVAESSPGLRAVAG